MLCNNSPALFNRAAIFTGFSVLKKLIKRIVIIVGSLFIGLIALAIVLSILFPDERTPEEIEATTTAKELSDQRAEETTVAKKNAATTAKETAVVLENSTPTPEQRILDSIEDAIGTKTNRDIPKISDLSFFIADNDLLDVNLRIAFDDNLSTSWVKSSARIDIADVLEQLKKDNLPVNNIHIEGTFALVDVRGNTSEDVVVRAEYSRREFMQVNWDNFLTDNIYIIADSVAIHPAFRD